MRICIHRGTQEIGGTCIEVEAQGKRIALDVGLPLDAPDDEPHENLLSPVPGFTEADDTLLGVLISHPHLDHYGLTRHIRPGVPIHIGEAAHRIMCAASDYVPNGHAFDNPHFLANDTPVQIGPFRITPRLVDHSAFDAYSLLVEANGKRVFYSGDFRGRRGLISARSAASCSRCSGSTARYPGSSPTSDSAMNETTGNASMSASWSSVRKRSFSRIRAKESGRPLASLPSS